MTYQLVVYTISRLPKVFIAFLYQYQVCYNSTINLIRKTSEKEIMLEWFYYIM